MRRTLLTWLVLSTAAGSLDGLVSYLKRPWVPPGTTTLTIASRSIWKAVEPNLNASGEHGLYNPLSNPGGWMVYEKDLAETLDTIIIHHSSAPRAEGPRQIQYEHTHYRGFADIGYHFVIDRTGRVYEGRSLTVRGAHTHGYNTGTIGIALIGDFEDVDPSPAQVTNAKALITYLSRRYTINRLAGHRDFLPDETLCPGRHLERLLPHLAAELGLKFGTAGYVSPDIP